MAAVDTEMELPEEAEALAGFVALCPHLEAIWVCDRVQH
jgi:hypothetical protein